ncbi:MAG: AAA family ATPase [Kiritimatiellae bacterium]|jgi:dephospho-CoA kinase|nr:AAA family ATPase [Kiritimatiellia bacterium]
MNKFIALVGMTGSGKSVVADFLVNERNFSFVRFGQITLDIVKERGLPPTEENEKKIREEVRSEHGMGAYAILNIPKFDKMLEAGNLVGDGLYSWSEYKILRDKYGDNLVVIAVYAPPKIRYERLVARQLKENDSDMRNRPATKDQAQSRDFAEIENIEKGGPIAMADYTIVNVFGRKNTIKQLNDILANEGI